MSVFETLFSTPSASEPVVPARRNPDDEIRRALRNQLPGRGRNFLTVDPTNGLSLYEQETQQAGSSGLSLPPQR